MNIDLHSSIYWKLNTDVDLKDYSPAPSWLYLEDAGMAHHT